MSRVPMSVIVVVGHVMGRNRQSTRQFGGKKSAIEIIDSSIWREEICNRNRTLDLAGRNRQ